MAHPSFADIRKKFNDSPVVMQCRPPKTNINNNESSADTSTSEKLERSKSNTSNQSFDDEQQTMSDSTALSSQASAETTASREKILARIIPKGAISYTGVNKPPVALPTPTNRDRDENTQFELSHTSEDTISPHMNPQDTHSYIGVKKPPALLPKPISIDRKEIRHSEPSSVSQDANEFTDVIKSPVPLSKSDSLNRNEYSHIESRSISLNAILPSKCMFFEIENILNNYQRRDPRTIIYPKTSAPIPMITEDELSLLRRYSNT